MGNESMIPGFVDWLNYRGTVLFGREWYAMEMFSTTEVFILLGKKNYHYPRSKGKFPLPNGYEKGRFTWSREEAERLWEWAYENGWFNKVEGEHEAYSGEV